MIVVEHGRANSAHSQSASSAQLTTLDTPIRPEPREKLGNSVSRISACHLDTRGRSGVLSLWQSGHYRSAVVDAAKNLNDKPHIKVGCRDESETDLFKWAFRRDAVVLGKRRRKPDSTDTYKSVQRGAWAVAEGIYFGIRNPFNHENPEDIDEQTGLECLARLSVLARRVDDGEVETAP